MRTALLCITAALASAASAQIVNIVDHDLAVKMKSVAQGAVDTVANTVDSSHPDALAVTGFSLLNPYSADITDLSGLEGFVNLAVLTVDGAGMTIMDDLPATVVYLTISQCFDLQQVLNWPPALETLILENLPYLAFWDDPPNTVESMSIVLMPQPPPIGSSWPSSLVDLHMYQVPMTAGVLQNLPGTLQWLSATANGITDLPALPAGLLALSLHDQDLTQLPALPNGLGVLNLGSSPIAALPPLPNTITQLSLFDLPIAAPTALPTSLQVLQTENCAMEPLPQLPIALTNMSVTNGGLTALPALPPDLQTLDVSTNQLTALPALPSMISNVNVSSNPGLTAFAALIGYQNMNLLWADNCALQSLPALPPNLSTLWVNGNPLTALPALPSTLNSLKARNTSITTLPPLPLGLTICDVQNCASLTCAPWLPPGITTFRAAGTGITCIPNQPATLNTFALGIPVVICDILNPCGLLNPAMLGTTYIDQDNDGVRDPGEQALPNATVELSPGNLLAGTNALGHYLFGLDVGTYSVTGVPALYRTVSSPPATATFTAWQQIDSLNDVGFYLAPNIQDLVLDQTGFTSERPGFDSHYHLSYHNVGTQVQDGSIVFTHDAAMTFVGSTPPPDAINGTMLTWNFTGLVIGEQRSIHVVLNTPAGTPLGTPIAHTAVADPLATDQTPADNTFVFASLVVGSYDPNDKQVQPSELTPAQVAAGERVNYTIRFQNTGTYLAERVIITDTLSTDLQWNTMQPIASSHEHTWFISNGVLHVLYDGIMLPDSASDEPASHGFFKFSMKPVSTLLLGDEVENVANIYFDFNEPIITNAAVFAVDNNVAVEVEPAAGPGLHPNPVHHLLYCPIPTSDPLARVHVLDPAGRVLLDAPATVLRQGLDVAHLQAGAYALVVAGRTLLFVKH